MKERMNIRSIVCKKFYVFLLFSVFVCSFPCIRATAEYHTGHFTIDLSYHWKFDSYSESTDCLYFYSDPIEYLNTEEVGIISIFEKEFNKSIYTRDTVYDTLVSVYSEADLVSDVKTETGDIDGIDSVLISFVREEYACLAAFCYKGDYALIITYFDSYGIGEAANSHFNEILKSINASPEHPKDDEERFTYAAHQVFGDSLFSSRAGKYPTVEIKTDCSDRSARKDIYKKTILFLEKVKGLRDEFGFDFQDIRINAYADVMDVYGNTDFISILGFNISAEDIDKINYKKIPSENVPKIAFNLFDLKLLP